MYAQDFFSTANIRTIHDYAAIKTSGTKQCRIQHVRPVRSGHQDDAFVRFETIHLDQQLVQSLLALIVSAAQAGTAMASNGVNFVDEDDAGSVLLTLFEQGANATRAHGYEHLNKVRSGDGKEGDISFTRNGAGQQGLACSRRSDEQDALRNASAELLKLLRLAQEFDNLAQLFLGFIHASHVLERDFLLLHGEQARAALA